MNTRITTVQSYSTKVVCRISVQYIFYALLCISSLVFFSCGMKDTIALAPASISGDSPVGWARVSHNTANTVQSFKGYDIYYKLYKTGDTSTINSDKNYITDSTRVPSRSTLTTKKFRLVKRFNQTSETMVSAQTPHIKPDSRKLSESYTVYIDFSKAGTYSPLRSSGGTKKISDAEYESSNDQYYKMLFITYNKDTVQRIEYLKRDTGSNTTKDFFEFKDGSYRYSADNDDIKDMIGKEFDRAKNAKLSIVFAVIPYGIDFAQAQVSYGAVVMTGALELDYQSTP